MEWQPIETAPKDGGYILLTDKDCVYTVIVARWMKTHKSWWTKATNSGKSIVWTEASHWMPLPEPPK